MRTLLNPLMMVNSFEKLFNTPGTHTLTLLPGRYQVAMRGGGGAGGASSAYNGGAGGMGKLTVSEVSITESRNLDIIVGAGGKTVANGGNGGGSGYGPAGGHGGTGGGGGMPSYVLFESSVFTVQYYGWKYAPTTNGKYTGPTKLFYVSYDTPQNIYISDTPHANTWGTFTLTNGTTYNNGQELFYAAGYQDDDEGDPVPVVIDYYGWTTPPTSSGKYIGQTKTFYVTYDDPATLYISDTPHANTWGTFTLTNGTTYTNGQQVFYASDSATVRVNISINNGTVKLTGTLTNAFGGSIVPFDVTDGFIGDIVLTRSASPAVGDRVYNGAFTNIGTITAISGSTFTYNGNTFSRYTNGDTQQELVPTVRVSVSISNGTVSLTGTATTEYPNSTVAPLNMTNDFIGGVILTQSATPAVGDDVYNESFAKIGTIASIAGDTITFGGHTYTRYVNIDKQQETNTSSYVLYTLGGGGGGGGAGSGSGGRYASGGGGGGGGGFYRFNTNTNMPESVPGKTGASGSAGRSYANGGTGTAGNTTDFPTLSSGGGSWGTRTGPGGGASGGGASGGGGGEGGNHTHGYGGVGGGGAGGDLDAGGGAGAAKGTNHHTIPTAVADDNASAGVPGDYGIGGGPNADGASGFVFIKRVAWT